MLKLFNIDVVYSKVIHILRGVSLEVPRGTIVALLGGNGAGKTTTLKAISGFIRSELGEITNGTIEFKGLRIDQKTPEKIVRMGIVQVMEGRRVMKHLTVEENLMIGSYLKWNHSNIKRNLDIVYSYFQKLKDLRHHESGFLSGGEQQMLVIGRALMGNPELILLDEPTMGLSPSLTSEIFKIIRRINVEEDTSILLVEQNAKAAFSVATYGYILENGRIVMSGPTETLKFNKDVKESYLGIAEHDSRRSFRERKSRQRKRWLSLPFVT